MLSALKPKHYVYIASLAGSLSLSAVNAPLGLTTTGLAGGYGVARMTQKNESVLEDQLDRSERLRESLEGEAKEEHDRVIRLNADKTALRRELDALKGQLAKVEQSLTKARTEAQQLRTGQGIKKLKADHESAVLDLSRQLAAVSAQKADEIQKATTPLKEQIATLQKEIAAANGRNQRTNKQKIERVRELRKTIEALENQVEELDGRLLQQAREHEAAVNALRQKYEADRNALLGEVDTTFDDYDKRYASVCDRADAAVGELEQHREQLSARVLELQSELATPARFGGLGAADKAGNALIDFLISKDVLMQAVETDPDPDKGLLVRLKPVNPVSLSDITKLMPVLEVALSLYSTPTVSYRNGLFSFRLALEKPLATAEQAPLRSNLDKLEKAIDEANHLRIVGGTGAGKSTFLDNAIWLGRCLWPASELELFDPKYPATSWAGDLSPDYKGPIETIAGMATLSEAVEGRRLEATELVDSGKEFPEFEPLIFAIDEAKEAYREALKVDRREGRNSTVARTFSDNLAGALSLGRAFYIKGYFLTQSLLCRNVGLNLDDFANCSNIFLNGMIDKAMDDELKAVFTKAELSVISKELKRRRDKGQKYIGLFANADTREFFLFESPLPGHYQARFERENSADVCAVNSGILAPFRSTAGSSKNPAQPKRDKGAEVSQGEDAPQGSAGSTQATAAPSAGSSAEPRAKCPKCSEASAVLDRAGTTKAGKYRFKCVNDLCDRKTFSALPEQ